MFHPCLGDKPGSSMNAPVIGKAFYVMKHWLDNSPGTIFRLTVDGQDLRINPAEGFVVPGTNGELIAFAKPKINGLKSIPPTRLSAPQQASDGLMLVTNRGGELVTCAGPGWGAEYQLETQNGDCGALVIDTSMATWKVVALHMLAAQNGVNGGLKLTQSIIEFMKDPTFPSSHN